MKFFKHKISTKQVSNVGRIIDLLRLACKSTIYFLKSQIAVDENFPFSQ
nr:MAG TPA: hypothetical protein [Caudoviricetes sp.]